MTSILKLETIYPRNPADGTSLLELIRDLQKTEYKDIPLNNWNVVFSASLKKKKDWVLEYYFSILDKNKKDRDWRPLNFFHQEKLTQKQYFELLKIYLSPYLDKTTTTLSENFFSEEWFNESDWDDFDPELDLSTWSSFQTIWVFWIDDHYEEFEVISNWKKISNEKYFDKLSKSKFLKRQLSEKDIWLELFWGNFFKDYKIWSADLLEFSHISTRFFGTILLDESVEINQDDESLKTLYYDKFLLRWKNGVKLLELFIDKSVPREIESKELNNIHSNLTVIDHISWRKTLVDFPILYTLDNTLSALKKLRKEIKSQNKQSSDFDTRQKWSWENEEYKSLFKKANYELAMFIRARDNIIRDFILQKWLEQHLKDISVRDVNTQ